MFFAITVRPYKWDERFKVDCRLKSFPFFFPFRTIQYIQPGDYQRLSQAELLVIDEAAAIPLITVKNLLGPYLVFMASTVNG
jgi:tRNA(Met) C34 N-acetyltransferase TmcA